MAKPDHTARACLSEPFWLVNEPQLPLSPEQARRHTYLMRVSGASLAMYVLRHLLRNSATYDGAKLAELSPSGHSWLFTSTQIEGLRAALYFLRLYNDGLLRAELGG